MLVLVEARRKSDDFLEDAIVMKNAKSVDVYNAKKDLECYLEYCYIEVTYMDEEEYQGNAYVEDMLKFE